MANGVIMWEGGMHLSRGSARRKEVGSNGSTDKYLNLSEISQKGGAARNTAIVTSVVRFPRRRPGEKIGSAERGAGTKKVERRAWSRKEKTSDAQNPSRK